MSEEASYPRRFTWRMRLFLGVMLFFIIYRPFCILFPWKEWAERLKVPIHPDRLATRAEREKLAARASEDRPFPLADSLLETLDSVWDYFKPWPGADTRKEIRGGADYAMFAVAWINSRAEVFELLAGFNTEWSMFSPSTSKRKHVPRARLLYADGSQEVVKGRTEPDDVTHYFRWFEVRLLNYEFKVEEDRPRTCRGYCNYLAHRYATNAAGAELKTIRLFYVYYDLPQPDEGSVKHCPAAWEAQQGPPDSQVEPDFFEYDVASRNGKSLTKK